MKRKNGGCADKNTWTVGTEADSTLHPLGHCARTISRNPFGDFVQWLASWVSDAIVHFAMAPTLGRHSTCILWEDLEASTATNQAVRGRTADFRVKLQVKRPQMSLAFSHTLLSQNQTANSKPIG